MTPFSHSQISQIHFGEEDQHQSHIPFFTLGASSNSTIPCPNLFDNYQQDHRANDGDHLHQHQSQLQEETVIQSEIQGSTWRNYVANQSSIYQFVREKDEQMPVKWMSSKMRFMRKMMNSDQSTNTRKSRRSTNHQHQYHKQPNQEISGGGNSPCGIVRVCSDCNTTKTPLWRSGPQGPKSLCNACGIRQRKARRAMAAATAACDADRTMPFKKRCRFAAAETTKRKICFEDIAISLNKSTACQRVFPQDEKDAAILLMALSCGLICS